MPPMHILLAEDDEGLRNALERLLMRRSHRVDAVADGRQAVDHLRAFEYDLIISDIQMPRLNGIQVLLAARELDPHAPVILMSGQVPAATFSDARHHPFEFLLKPFAGEDLIQKIERVQSRVGMVFSAPT